MAKKAFLVTYECMTRVIVDVPENANADVDVNSDTFNDGLYDEIELKAEEKILPCAQKYICIDNSSIVEDTENPYDPEND